MSLFKVLPTVLLVILCGHCQLLQATKTNRKSRALARMINNIILLPAIINSNDYAFFLCEIDVDLVILEFLISMKQSGDGIEFFIIPRNDGLQSHLDSATYESKSVPNRQLPQDCGDELFRCNPLVISQTDSEYYLLLVPIHGGLLIVELKHPTNSLKLEFGSHRVLESGDAVDCSPTMIFKVDNSYYTVCTNLRSKKITVYEIRLNGSVIEQVQLLGPLVREYLSGVLDVLSSSAVMNMSNFLLSLDDPHQPLIYFAIENYLFAIDLIDYAPLYSQIPSIGHGTSCQSVHRLVHASTNQLLAYCSTEYVYYSTEDELSHDEHSYTDSGVPYLCPNDTYTVSAFDNYLEYTIGSRSGTLTNVNVDMYSGMCFTGLRNISFFVYNDKVADKNVLVDLTSGGRKSILCKSMNCLPIIAVQDPVRYLVVRELSNDGRVNVLDVEKNFSVIISANHEASEMFAVLSVGAHKPPGPPRKDVISSHGAIVGGIMAGIVIFIVVVTTLVLILTYFVVKRIRLRYI